MPLVSSLRGPWGESGRRATPSLGGWGECGPTLRQCLSFADPRNQAVRAVASRRVPGARSCQGACGLCPPDQKARPGGCLLRAPSAQLQPTWQPWPHPQGEGLDAIGCPGCWWPRPPVGQLMAQRRTLIDAYLFANACMVSYSSLSSSAASLLPNRSGVGGQCAYVQWLSHSLRMETKDCALTM